LEKQTKGKELDVAWKLVPSDVELPNDSQPLEELSTPFFSILFRADKKNKKQPNLHSFSIFHYPPIPLIQGFRQTPQPCRASITQYCFANMLGSFGHHVG
jgi:hypothetical protein